MSKALVLAGGGVTGIAWELGVIAGLAEHGIDLRDADLIVGTSAGAAVAAQITSGVALADLVDRQLVPPEESAEIAAELDLEVLGAIFSVLMDTTMPADERRAKVGAAALAAATVPEPTRRAVIEARLPRHEWPETRIVLTAVDATNGEVTLFDRHSDVGLVDAVTASTAVPGVWPPVTIGASRYVDGGVRSATNVDLARGHDAVLVLSPMPADYTLHLATEVAELDLAGSTVAVLHADEEAQDDMGPNPLDPARREPAVRAGLRQGALVADDVRLLWI